MINYWIILIGFFIIIKDLNLQIEIIDWMKCIYKSYL
jgi:hypothetical protein